MHLSETSIRLSLPYNHDDRFPEWLAAHCELVGEVYLPIHRAVASTARPWLGPMNPATYRDRLRRLAPVLRAHGLGANVVINLLVLWEQRAGVIEEVGRLRDEVFAELLSVAVADFELGRLLRARFPDLELSVSTVAEVDSPTRAAYWVDDVGVGSICISRAINKRLDVIRAIRDLGVKVKMVLDDCCGIACPSILSHAALGSEAGERSGEQPCFARSYVRRRPWLIAQKDVVPATLSRYDGLIDRAKLDGRVISLESIERKLSLYVAATSWEHPASIYVEPEDAFDRIAGCDRRCPECRWCEQAFDWRWDKLLPPGEDPGADRSSIAG
ncbi:MAG: U32 family peptidase [Deltaproteobacteria bacterium]|nr:U32 family peptidase [Deltaproteobacteria bacterium]